MMTSAYVVETSVNVSDSNLLQTVLTRAIASLNNGRWSWVQVVGTSRGQWVWVWVQAVSVIVNN